MSDAGTADVSGTSKYAERLYQLRTVYFEQLRIFKKSRMAHIYLGMLLLIPLVGMTFLRILYNEFDLQISAVRIILYALPLAMSLIIPRIAGSPLQDEYSRNTAYSTFTVPVSRSVIYIGKYLAAYTLTAVVFIGVYIMGILTGFMFESHGIRSPLTSLMLCLVGVFAISGTTYGISAHIRKGAVPLTTVANLSIPIIFVLFLILANGSFMAAMNYMLSGLWDFMKVLPPFIGYNAMYILNPNPEGIVTQALAVFTVYPGPIYHLVLFSSAWGLAFLYIGHRRFMKKDM